jgi:hypothetical protein
MEDRSNFEVPLELQFSVRKAEMAAKEMTWEQLYAALMNLYQQRLMEWHAVQCLLQDEDIELNFDVPTDMEMMQLASSFQADGLEFDDDDDLISPF